MDDKFLKNLSELLVYAINWIWNFYPVVLTVVVAGAGVVVAAGSEVVAAGAAETGVVVATGAAGFGVVVGVTEAGVVGEAVTGSVGGVVRTVVEGAEVG